MKNLVLLFAMVMMATSMSLRAAEVKEDDCSAFAESTRRVSKEIKSKNNHNVKSNKSKAKSE